MEKKGSILAYRDQLDKTLNSPDLTDHQTIHNLVKNQISQSLNCRVQDYNNVNIVERRSKELSDFLAMLRSTFSNESWKVKEDTDELRVMHREGPDGASPFQTLLVEGYVDGPIDICLCILCEADLYKHWWPQTTVPAFKVASSECVEKIRPGEQISLVRMKFPWPLSSREALVHSYTFDYLQDGLVIVLLTTIPESEVLNKTNPGFTPDAVRIDAVGGFAIQKVSESQSFFRAIGNLDFKLNFAPTAFINFVARQLVGSGFKLMKQEIGIVCRDKEKQRWSVHDSLEDSLYVRIREALYSKRTMDSMEEVMVVNVKETDEESSSCDMSNA